MGKKILTQEIIDESTGEIKRVNTFVEVKNIDRFVMSYLGSKDYDNRLKTVNESKVISYLRDIVEYNTGKVYLTSERRKEMMEFIGIPKSTLSSSLKGLVLAGILIGSRNDYIVNPRYFWFGDHKSRQDVLKESEKDFFKRTKK